MLDFSVRGKLDGYTVREGLLFKEVNDDLLLVVPTLMQNQIIRNAYEGGHFSIAKIEALLKKDYYIPNVQPKIAKLIANCVTCILADRKSGRQERFLNCLETREIPLNTYNVDHLGLLPSTKKKL